MHTAYEAVSRGCFPEQQLLKSSLGPFDSVRLSQHCFARSREDSAMIRLQLLRNRA